MDPDFDPQAYLEVVSSQDDEEIDLACTALALAVLEHEGAALSACFHHLRRLADDTGSRFHALLESGRVDDAALRLEALTDVLAEDYGYVGDTLSYDDLQNASLIRVIDRGRGWPVSLSILYIHAARAQGWDIAGLEIPGYFVCRLDHGGQRVVFDPFHGGAVLAASDLRGLVKKALGPKAELSGTYYEPVSNRRILLRLENDIKNRKIDAEDYAGALRHVERMRVVAPQEYRLLLDAGVLYARTGQPGAAIEALEAYIAQAPDHHGRREAEFFLEELRQSLH